MITWIDKNAALMSHDVKNISKNVMIQKTTSFADHQDLVKRVNLLQQSQDANRETQFHILSRLMVTSNRLGISDDDVKEGLKKLVGTSFEVEVDHKKDDGDDTNATEA
ncbi:hypothetical protein POM88_011794 [Heracleum sosnowskyi]|uniref:Uncharacterized protein n=1 Tax=Heracleum sosnowskyi TaxID=360622 RepID=A0AAD8IWW2_9APIA|nr:hypothetical protein POM88_011794 [Heracleum sosnowskyi]